MMMTRVENLPALPPRPVGGHKGLFGRVLVVGGSESFLGAPVFAGTAALRMGSGIVELAMPKGLLTAALTITPELVGLPLGAGSAKALMAAAEKASAIVLGPGLGQSLAAKERVALLIKMNKPMVIDADALNILSAGIKWPAGFKAKAVVTPHPGEMKRLIRLIGKSEVPTDDQGRLEIAAETARAFDVVVVLKGERTVITDGERYFINTTGDSSLSKGGSGDILSGMLGCLLGQKIAPFDAACLAVNLHGRAGEAAGRKLGRRCVLSRDVIEAISGVVGDGNQ
jgi:NAD(P)H-hydrate epimerase